MKDWLSSELKAIAAPSERARFALDLSEERVALLERSWTGLWSRGVAVHGAPDFSEAIARLRQKVKGLGRKAVVDLMLPEAFLLSRIDTYPAEAASDLRDAVWWRLDGFHPSYAAEELRYDVAVVGSDPVTGFLQLHAAAAPAEIVNEALAFARNWGFEPNVVTAGAPLEGFEEGPIFARGRPTSAANRPLRRSAAMLTAAIAVLSLVAVGRAVLERRALAAEATEARIAAEAELSQALALRERTLDLADRAARASTLRRETPLTVDRLTRLSQIMPPRTVADRIVFDDKILRLEGEADNADAVVSALDVAPEFVSPRRAAEGVRDVGAGRTRFVVEAGLAAAGAAPSLAEDGQ